MTLTQSTLNEWQRFKDKLINLRKEQKDTLDYLTCVAGLGKYGEGFSLLDKIKVNQKSRLALNALCKINEFSDKLEEIFGDLIKSPGISIFGLLRKNIQAKEALKLLDQVNIETICLSGSDQEEVFGKTPALVLLQAKAQIIIGRILVKIDDLFNYLRSLFPATISEQSISSDIPKLLLSDENASRMLKELVEIKCNLSEEIDSDEFEAIMNELLSDLPDEEKTNIEILKELITSSSETEINEGENLSNWRNLMFNHVRSRITWIWSFINNENNTFYKREGNVIQMGTGDCTVM